MVQNLKKFGLLQLTILPMMVQQVLATVHWKAIAEHSDDWAGWGFRDGKAWLLFKLKTDAIYAKNDVWRWKIK